MKIKKGGLYKKGNSLFIAVKYNGISWSGKRFIKGEEMKKYICNKAEECANHTCRHRKKHKKTAEIELGCEESICGSIKKGALAKCIEVKNKISGGR